MGLWLHMIVTKSRNIRHDSVLRATTVRNSITLFPQCCGGGILTISSREARVRQVANCRAYLLVAAMLGCIHTIVCCIVRRIHGAPCKIMEKGDIMARWSFTGLNICVHRNWSMQISNSGGSLHQMFKSVYQFIFNLVSISEWKSTASPALLFSILRSVRSGRKLVTARKDTYP